MADNYFPRLMNALKTSGVFITLGKERPNVMSTYWGAAGNLWNKQVFILPVRENKLSHEILTKTGEFIVNVPYIDMCNEIAECSRLNGYDVDKFEELHLHVKPAKQVNSYIISQCSLFLECRVIFSCPMTDIPAELEDLYQSKNKHTVFFGEIVQGYEKE